MTYLFSFKDISVYTHDLILLNQPHWLNDVCISLAFRFLDEQFGTSSPNVADHALLVDPSVVSFLRIQAEDEEDFEGLSNGIQVKSFKWLLLPVNNSMDFGTASTHWSLLICYTPTFCLFHCDSCGSLNLPSAKHLIPKLRRLLLVSPSVISSLVTVSVPQQENSYDCGIYAILFSRQFLQMLHECCGDDEVDVSSMSQSIQSSCASITPQSASEFRKELRTLIRQKFHI